MNSLLDTLIGTYEIRTYYDLFELQRLKQLSSEDLYKELLERYKENKKI